MVDNLVGQLAYQLEDMKVVKKDDMSAKQMAGMMVDSLAELKDT